MYTENSVHLHNNFELNRKLIIKIIQFFLPAPLCQCSFSVPRNHKHRCAKAPDIWQRHQASCCLLDLHTWLWHCTHATLEQDHLRLHWSSLKGNKYWQIPPTKVLIISQHRKGLFIVFYQCQNHI